MIIHAREHSSKKFSTRGQINRHIFLETVVFKSPHKSLYLHIKVSTLMQFP